MRKQNLTNNIPFLNKMNVLKALSTGLQQLSFNSESDEPVFAANTKQTKNGIEVECTNGSTIVLEVKSITN